MSERPIVGDFGGGVSCSECTALEPAPGLVRLSFCSYLPDAACRVADGVELVPERRYVVETADGERLGLLRRYRLPVLRGHAGAVVGTVARCATPAEEERSNHLEEVAADALRHCRDWARRERVDFRPVWAFAPLDRNHLLVSFVAEQRIDFRTLLRDLGQRTRRRVELRQIGVRDQAKAQGGWGPCGRTLCCSTFMERFNSVTIRMAKAQNLSLNPTRISGMCGRLMCCLAHEAPSSAGRLRAQT